MADYVRYYVFAMIVLYFGWRLDRAYGLMTHATQRGALLGIHWVFVGTFLGTAALPCIAHPCSDAYGVLLLVNKCELCGACCREYHRLRWQAIPDGGGHALQFLS
jgi:hypothetical protein